MSPHPLPIARAVAVDSENGLSLQFMSDAINALILDFPCGVAFWASFHAGETGLFQRVNL
jgi:hypothetical protein